MATPEQLPVLFSFRLWRLEAIFDRNIHVGGIYFRWYEVAPGPTDSGETVAAGRESERSPAAIAAPGARSPASPEPDVEGGGRGDD